MEVVIIVAVAENGVIGADGSIPWHFSADLRRFKRLTTGHPVIMGRRTYEGILETLGEPLPDRTSIVLTHQDLETPQGVVTVDSVEAALAAAREMGAETAFVAGGATVYEQFLSHADRLERTEVHGSYDGDTEFPEWDAEQWEEVTREEHEAFDFVTYVRA
jgi:dihydrofolate reductase